MHPSQNSLENLAQDCINFPIFHSRIGFLGIPNKLLQTGSLKAMEMYSLRVLDASNLKLRCQQGHVLCESCREEYVLASSWLMVIVSSPSCSSTRAAPFQFLPSSSGSHLTFISLCVSKSPLFVDISHWIQSPSSSSMTSF